MMLLAVARLDAQTTEFTYQGRLNDGAIAASGSYDFEFDLFNAGTNGTSLGTQIVPNVTVTNGVFTVKLNFGAVFPGAGRWLEIHLKPSGSADPYTILTPRQAVTSAPYAVKSVSSETAATATNSIQLGGVNASEFIQNSDARLTNDRNPTAGSSHYVQNTAVQQAVSNFNVSGTGTADIFSAGTQFNIGSERVLGVGQGNTFVGRGAGTATGGQFNAFFGSNAGLDNTSGFGNSFFGSIAGVRNTTGNSNSFFGRTTGANNSTGSFNSFFGQTAGNNNTIGSNNTIIGQSADVAVNNLNFATAIGSEAVVSNSNSIVLGRPAGSDAVRIPGPVLIDGSLVVRTLGSAGSTPLCLNGADRIATCTAGAVSEKTGTPILSSDLKTATALKEQQKRIDELQKQIEVLKAVVCAANSQPAPCENHLRKRVDAAGKIFSFGKK